MIIHPKPASNKHPKKDLGYVHVYTGEGKGKTSAALGVLLRSAGKGHNVLMVQFLKGDKDSGELQAVHHLAEAMRNNKKGAIELVQFGREDLLHMDDLQTVDAYFANQAIEFAREALRSKLRPDVLILDELATAVKHGLIPLQDVVDFIDNRHQNTELVITGRDAHPALLNMADLVTVMTPSKHYYNYEQFEPRHGIEH